MLSLERTRLCVCSRARRESCELLGAICRRFCTSHAAALSAPPTSHNVTRTSRLLSNRLASTATITHASPRQYNCPLPITTHATLAELSSPTSVNQPCIHFSLSQVFLHCGHSFASDRASMAMAMATTSGASPVVRLRGGVRGLPSLESRRVVRVCSSWKLVVQAAKSSPSASKGSSTQSHMDLLERMTENNSTASQGEEVMTIRDQLANQVAEPEVLPEVVVVPLATGGAPDVPPPDLTISQRRNIRRQNYMNKVSERNDAPFFAAVAGFVLLPPILILGYAVATGYIELFP